jgi:hypothetical protein
MYVHTDYDNEVTMIPMRVGHLIPIAFMTELQMGSMHEYFQGLINEVYDTDRPDAIIYVEMTHFDWAALASHLLLVLYSLKLFPDEVSKYTSVLTEDQVPMILVTIAYIVNLIADHMQEVERVYNERANS